MTRVPCLACASPAKADFLICINCWARTNEAQRGKILCLRFDADLPSNVARGYLYKHRRIWMVPAHPVTVVPITGRLPHFVYLEVARFNPAYALWMLEDPALLSEEKPPHFPIHRCEYNTRRPNRYGLYRHIFVES